MTAKYGPDIDIVHGDETGVAESFATAARGQRIRTKEHPIDFGHLGDGAIRFRNRTMLRGAGLCVIVHRSVLEAGTKELGHQALSGEVPTYVIKDEEGVPKRLKEGDSSFSTSRIGGL
jgi:hypothetical protein